MKRLLVPVLTVAVTAASAAALVVGLTTTSSLAAAGAAPPWEPDHQSKGGLLFYSSAGKKITGGSLTAAPFAAYVQGAVPVRKGDTKATLYGYLPKKGEVPGQFSGEQLTTSDGYPNSKAPKALRASALPLVSLSKSDETLGELFQDFPNPAKSGNSYSGLYELRLITSRAGSSATSAYDSADIAVSNVTTSKTGTVTGGSWKLVYSAASPIATHTSLKVSPRHSASKGHKVTLTATVSPKVAGTVTFKNGSKLLAKVKVKAGEAKYVTKKLAVGSHRLRAAFTPASKPYVASTSTTVKFTVKK